MVHSYLSIVFHFVHSRKRLGLATTYCVYINSFGMAEEFEVNAMQSYWYISKRLKKPKKRGLIKIIKRTNYLIIELSNKADKDSLDKCQLIYLGCGEFNDRHIQSALLRNHF